MSEPIDPALSGNLSPNPSEAVAGPHVLAGDEPGGSAPAPTPAQDSVGHRPSYVFFGVVAAISLAADVASKAWAEITLGKRTLLDPALVLVKDHLSLTLAYNKGGAWGLLQTAPESVRRPFFLVVSVLAIAFIISLYRRLGAGPARADVGLAAGARRRAR